MGKGLFRAVYISTARHDLRDEELATLLDVSRRNNAARGITGALAYHDHAFIQVLEGRRPRSRPCSRRSRATTGTPG
jgi:hypothetical protein